MECGSSDGGDCNYKRDYPNCHNFADDWLADDKCDIFYNSKECDYDADGGPDCHVNDPKKVGTCKRFFGIDNTSECGYYDGGDCPNQ